MAARNGQGRHACAGQLTTRHDGVPCVRSFEGTYGEGIGMRRLGTGGMCVVVALAICAVAAASASAVAPQFGRCVKTKAGGSGYSSSSCTVAVGSGAKFEWLSGPGAGAHFSSAAGNSSLETTTA